MGTMKERIDSCINEWKRRLIDLTRRNRLIYFVPKRSSSLQIAEPTPSEVFNRFVIEEKPLRCFIPQRSPYKVACGERDIHQRGVFRNG